MVLFIALTMMIWIFIPTEVKRDSEESPKVRQVDVKNHTVFVIRCLTEDNGLVISGAGASSSDIYDSVDYTPLIKQTFINMVSLGLKCSLTKETIKMEMMRHIKITLIGLSLEENYAFVYWTDVDCYHHNVNFLKNNCEMVASQESKSIVDQHFIDTFGHQAKKFMSGNLFIRNNPHMRHFVELWRNEMYKEQNILEDQWAFERLTNTHPSFLCSDSFMSYKDDSDVIHFVSKEKYQLMNDRSKVDDYSISDVLSRFLINLKSDECQSLFISRSNFISIVSKTLSDHWRQWNVDHFNDDDVKDIWMSCVGFNPFVRKIQMIDFIRYVILFQKGGWYFDDDTIPTDHFNELDFRSNNNVVGVEEVVNKKVIVVYCQWAFKFQKGSPDLLHLMEEIILDSLLFTKMELPTSWLTGPMRFTRMVLKNKSSFIIMKIKSFTNYYVNHMFKASWLNDESWDDLRL